MEVRSLFIYVHVHICVCIIYLFIIFGRTGSLLLCGLFSSCSKRGLLSSCGAQASHCGSFYSCQAQALGCLGFTLWPVDSVVAVYGLLEHRLNSCGTQA